MKPENEQEETQHTDLAESESREEKAAPEEEESPMSTDTALTSTAPDSHSAVTEPDAASKSDDEIPAGEPTNDAIPEVDEDSADTDTADSDDAEEAAVVYENGRPLVQELEYQAPRGKAAAAASPEDAESTDVKFGSVSEAKAVIEGFLFSSNEPVTVNRLSKLMSNLHPKTVRGLLLELQWDYENRPGGLQVVEIAGGYQMSTRAFVAPWMFRMHKHKRRSALSPATLETLAIIAYRQPITKGEIEAIRGVESGAPLRTLQELNLIEASGRREVIGRPQLYVTTETFLKTFGLKSMADLPSISELKSRFADEQKLKAVVAAPVDANVDTADPAVEIPLDEHSEGVALEGGALEATTDELDNELEDVLNDSRNDEVDDSDEELENELADESDFEYEDASEDSDNDDVDEFSDGSEEDDLDDDDLDEIGESSDSEVDETDDGDSKPR